MLLFAIFLPPSTLRAQERYEFWPEVDTYVSLSSRSRLFFLDARSSDQDTRSLHGEFGANVDSYLRRYLRESLHPKDSAKNKLLTLCLGYRFLPSLRGDNPNEQRLTVEVTGRRLLLLTILFSDRNLIDFRFLEGNPYS